MCIGSTALLAEWQAKEQEADEAAAEAVAEGRVRTFDAMDEMIAFLDAQ